MKSLFLDGMRNRAARFLLSALCILPIASGCNQTSFPKAPNAPDDEHIPLDPYARERIEIRTDEKNPDRFMFCTIQICMSENEFVRRFATVTGSHDLDEYDTDRNANFHETGALLMGVGAVLAIAGGVTLATAKHAKNRKDEDGQYAGGGIEAGLGVGLLAVGGGLLGAPRDGHLHDHLLSRARADDYVLRFNDTLRSRYHQHPNRDRDLDHDPDPDRDVDLDP
jgi:hypothetical protein